MLDVRGSRELQAALLTIRTAERELRLDINKEARSEISSAWRESVLGFAESRTDVRILAQGARAQVGTRQVSLKAATSNRPLRGGLIPSKMWQAQEFGMRNYKKTITTTSRLGNKYQVTRTIGRQFPGRQRNGRVVFNAASLVVTRLVSIWVRTIVRKFAAVAEITPR